MKTTSSIKREEEASATDYNADEESSGIELTWLSWDPHRPCILLKFRGLKVLLDCALGMESMASFLPCSIVRSNRISWQKKVHPYGKGAIPILRTINSENTEHVYVDLVPEVRAVPPSDLNPASLDAIFVSNISSLLALPFVTEGDTGFRGTVYATDPIIQLGKLIMEDICNMFERVDRPASDEWAWKSLSKSFPNPPVSDDDATLWRQFYTREAMESCLARVQRVFYREDITLLNGELRVTPHSSGHSIGACNWLIQTSEQKIGYLASSSLRHSHPKPMELPAFAHLDHLLLSSMSTVEQSPEVNVYKFTSAVVETLKSGGNVLVPIVPTGLVYDLFECVLKAIEVNNLSRNIPVYFISSIAESSFEFANIFSEWLSDDKSARVFEPKEPFFHSELMRSGRIRVFDSLSGAFSRECRQPCIVFTGHPSLRIGAVVHMLDFWGGNHKDAILMIDPDYPINTYYAPYKSLAIRAYSFPIETRLDRDQMTNKIIGDLEPRHVLHPKEYTEPLFTKNKTSMNANNANILANLRRTELRYNEHVELTVTADRTNLNGETGGVVGGSAAADVNSRKKKSSSRKRILVNPEILQWIKPNVRMQGLCPLMGLLATRERSLELMPVAKKTRPIEEAGSIGSSGGEKPVQQQQEKLVGRLDVKQLMEALLKRELAVEQRGDDGIFIKNFSAHVQLLQDGRRTKISCLNDAHRKAVQGVVHECLAKFVVVDPALATAAPSAEEPMMMMLGGGAMGPSASSTIAAAPLMTAFGTQL